MQEQWLPISDIPVQGREFYFEDDQDWILLWNVIDPDCEIAGDMIAVVTVLPQKQGVFFKGYLKGWVSSPCFRCLEPGQIYLDHGFELFEDFDENREEQLGAGILKFENGKWMVNIRLVVREQLVLAMPDKILCSDDCPGLCPVCGENIYKSLCQCGPVSGDPRLAKIKQLKIKKKQ